ncbi:hypothetical protein F5Y05DRAFT_420414 [Hypoxylon sp. FL0543]|nr:hypothetical protein F5Y05DRAFT_420414 [Hypoxylon sp. FL0543]
MASPDHFLTHIGDHTNKSPAHHLSSYQVGDNDMTTTFQQSIPFGDASYDHPQDPFQKQGEVPGCSQDIIMTDAPLDDSLEFHSDELLSCSLKPTDVTDSSEMCWEPHTSLTYPISMDIDSEYDNNFDFQPTISKRRSKSVSAYETRANGIHESRRPRAMLKASYNDAIDCISRMEALSTEIVGLFIRRTHRIPAGSSENGNHRPANRDDSDSFYYKNHGNSQAGSHGNRH